MNADDDKCEDHHTTLFAVVFCLIVKANMPLQAAIHTGQIRAELARKGTPVGPYDQMIAAMPVAADWSSSQTISASLNAFRVSESKTGANFCIRCYPRIQTLFRI